MRKIVFSAMVFMCCAMANLSAQQTVRVKSAAEFVRALGSNKIIELAPGRYSLKDAYAVKSNSVSWVDVGSGHKELLIKNVSGLTIRRQGQSGVAEIVSASAYARVLNFEGGDTIALENLTMGHKAEGPCSAGVLSFSSVNDIVLSGCDLYGSGALGLELRACSTVSVDTTTIRECTAGAITIEDSTSVDFTECSIVRNTGSYPLLAVINSQGVYFSSCEISENKGDAFLYSGEGTGDWGFEYCTIADNEIDSLSGDEAYPYFFDCTVANNYFDEELGGLLTFSGDGYEDEGDGDYSGEDDGEFSFWQLESVPLSFYYPSWFETQEAEDGVLMVSDPETSSGILIMKAYTLVKGENPDTQAAAIFKKAAAAFQKILVEKGMKINARIGGDYVETEAHPYYYTYMHSFVIDNDAGYGYFKLVHSSGQIWAFVALSQNQEDLAEDGYLGSILGSIEESE